LASITGLADPEMSKTGFIERGMLNSAANGGGGSLRQTKASWSEHQRTLRYQRRIVIHRSCDRGKRARLIEFSVRPSFLAVCAAPIIFEFADQGVLRTTAGDRDILGQTARRRNS